MKCRLPMRIGGSSGGGVNYVEWIKGDGSSYFDTGFKPNQNTRVVMKARHPSTTTELFYFGARNGYLSGAFDVRIRNNSAAWQIEYAGTSTTMTADYTQMQTVDFNKNVFSVGTTSKSFTAATFQCNYSLYLYALNNVGSAANIAPELYIEQCQIYDNSTLVRDYRAAVDPDGIACFYDEASQSYVHGKGTFTAGASIGGGSSSGGASEYTVSIAAGSEYLYYTTINGTKYLNATQVTISKGAAVTVWISDAYTASYISLNGTKVAQVSSGGASYTFVPTGDVSITYPIASGVPIVEITTSSGGSGSGGSAAPTPVSVTITGTGNTTYCYATINGTKYYGAGSYEVMPGDKITFGVYGRNSTNYGRVTIDGQQVLNVTNQTTQTYEWTVPDDISAVSMQMSYTSSSYSRNGRIVVTTTKKPTGGSGSGGASEYAVTYNGTNPNYPQYGYLTINGEKYDSAQTIAVNAGTKVEIYIGGNMPSAGYCFAYLNGTKVAENTSYGAITYTHTVNANCTIAINGTNGTIAAYTAYITTE